MLPGTFRAIMVTAALVAAVTGCSLMPAPTAAPAGQAEREVRPWNNVRVAWGADEEGGQAIWADITGTTPQGPDSIRILTIWDTKRATLALGAAPGIDPGSDPSSPRP
jgi:hypothetical protein